jgi:hypothetical protein
MSITLTIVGGLAIGLIVLWRRRGGKIPWKRKQEPAAQESQEPKNTTTVPSVYTVRGNRLFLARRRIIPRLIMWGVILIAIGIALYLFNPHMFLYTIKAVGPSISTALLGFAVLGIGQSMEETHESYEFSKLGWGGAIVLWIIALVTLLR